MDALDQRLSQRFIALDPSGYFLIKLDRDAPNWCLSTTATPSMTRGWPEIPRPVRCCAATGQCSSAPFSRLPRQYGQTAGHPAHGREAPHPVSRLDHALYLGRELQKAEQCLRDGTVYVQD